MIDFLDIIHYAQIIKTLTMIKSFPLNINEIRSETLKAQERRRRKDSS